jgi:hypothetical protein
MYSKAEGDAEDCPCEAFDVEHFHDARPRMVAEVSTMEAVQAYEKAGVTWAQLRATRKRPPD